jgi:hypothetical protein
MEQPMHELAAGAGQKDSGDLRGQPKQIAATTCHDHKRVGWGYFRAR